MSQESVENAVGPIEIAAGESGLDVLINNVGVGTENKDYWGSANTDRRQDSGGLHGWYREHAQRPAEQRLQR